MFRKNIRISLELCSATRAVARLVMNSLLIFALACSGLEKTPNDAGSETTTRDAELGSEVADERPSLDKTGTDKPSLDKDDVSDRQIEEDFALRDIEAGAELAEADGQGRVDAEDEWEDVGPVEPKCGNGICEPSETAKTCFEDCHCGDGVCQPEVFESMKNCPKDCCECGDCECNPMHCGENSENCPIDCKFACGDHVMSPGESPRCCPLDACWTGAGSGCGDGICMGKQCDETPETCPQDCATSACGNKVCDKGENPFLCPEDCLYKVCGNGSCEPPNEDVNTCSIDCKPGCGNCNCEIGEDFVNCPVDCGYCGDGICSKCVEEDMEKCPKDCV